MAYTITAPSEPKVKGPVTYEEHLVSAGTGTEISTTTVSARFINNIDRAYFHGPKVISKTINNDASPSTVSFKTEGPQGVLAGGNITIATTGNTDVYVIVPQDGNLVAVDFSGVDALAANDTNFITYSITNLGQAGAGSTAMLAATDTNTTKATGGSALVANGKRSLTLHGTAANLVVVGGDRLRIRAAATGTLANTVTGSAWLVRFGGPTEGVIVLESDRG